MDSVSVKACSKCGETKPLTEFGPDKRKRLGVQAQCRPCKNGYRKPYALLRPAQVARRNELRNAARLLQRDERRHVWDYRRMERDKQREREAHYQSLKSVPEGMKRCMKCLAIKRVRDFSRHRQKRDGRNSWCQTCVLLFNNPRAWQLANPDKYNAAVAAAAFRRRTRLRSMPIERVSISKLIKRDGALCQICRRAKGTDRWSIDHILPVSFGGSHTFANTRLAHLRCNVVRRNTGAAQLRLIG